jgi:hypothetical protein
VIAVFMLIGLPIRKLMLATAKGLQSDGLPSDPRDLDEPQQRHVFAAVWKVMPPQWRGKAKIQAGAIEQVLESATQKPLSIGTSIGIGLLWIAGLAITGVAIVAFAIAPPAHWKRYENEAHDFSIELPAAPKESVDHKVNMLIANLGRKREYGVSWLPVPQRDGWEVRLEGAMFTSGKRLRTLSIPDSDAAFVSILNGSTVAVRFVWDDGVGYIVMGAAPSDEPDSERAVRSFQVH